MLTPVFLQFSVTKTARLRLEKSKYSPPDEVVESTESLIVISVLIAMILRSPLPREETFTRTISK